MIQPTSWQHHLSTCPPNNQPMMARYSAQSHHEMPQASSAHLSFLEDLYSSDDLPVLPLRSEADFAAFLSPTEDPVPDESTTEYRCKPQVSLEMNSNIVGGDMSDMKLLSPNLDSMPIPVLKFDDISHTFSDTGNSTSGIFSDDSNNNDINFLSLTEDINRVDNAEPRGDTTPVNKLAQLHKNKISNPCAEEVNKTECDSDEKPGLTFYNLSPISNASSSVLNDSDTTTTGSPMSSPESLKASSPTDTNKPPGSYISLLAKAILGSLERRMVLGDIYEHFLDAYPFFRNTTCAWRNSIRHNLSVNECFIKDGRAKNGKGFFWAIHPSCVEDFMKGDFDRRTARKRVMLTNRTLADSIRKCAPQPQHSEGNRNDLMHLQQMSNDVQKNQHVGGGAMRNYASNDTRISRTHPYYHGYASEAHQPSHNMQPIQPQMTSPFPHIQPYGHGLRSSVNHPMLTANTQDWVFY